MERIFAQSLHCCSRISPELENFAFKLCSKWFSSSRSTCVGIFSIPRDFITISLSSATIAIYAFLKRATHNRMSAKCWIIFKHTSSLSFLPNTQYHIYRFSTVGPLQEPLALVVWSCPKFSTHCKADDKQNWPVGERRWRPTSAEKMLRHLGVFYRADISQMKSFSHSEDNEQHLYWMGWILGLLSLILKSLIKVWCPMRL